jgi:MFS family permease
MAGVVAVAASVALYATTTSLWGLLAVSALVGLTVGVASVPLPTMVGDLAPEGTEGVAAGVFRMANDLGWIVGPLVLGAMADGGLWALGFVVAGVPLLVAGLLFLGAPETLRR